MKKLIASLYIFIVAFAANAQSVKIVDLPTLTGPLTNTTYVPTTKAGTTYKFSLSRIIDSIVSLHFIARTGNDTITGIKFFNANTLKIGTTADYRYSARLRYDDHAAENSDIVFPYIAHGTVAYVENLTSGVTTFNTRTGAVTLNGTDVTTALGYTPYNGSTNPFGFINSFGVTFTAGTGDVSGSASSSGDISTSAIVTPSLTIGNGKVTAAKIASLAVTNAKINDVDWSKITSTPTTVSGYGITDAAASSHTHTFASLTSKPTTLSGYGITDAASSSHTHTFASLTSVPTTLSGYGITDAASSSHTHTFASLTSVPTTLSGYGITDALSSSASSITIPTYYGSSSSAGTITLSSTSHATKGKLLFGSSAYDEANNRLFIGATATSGTARTVEVNGTVSAAPIIKLNENVGGSGTSFIEYSNNGTQTGYFGYESGGSSDFALYNGKSSGAFRFYCGGYSEKMRLFSTGNLSINTTTDAGYKLDVNGTGRFQSTVTSTQYKLSALNTAPSSSSDTGTTGEVRITSTYIYVCTATNTWVRTALATW